MCHIVGKYFYLSKGSFNLKLKQNVLNNLNFDFLNKLLSRLDLKMIVNPHQLHFHIFCKYQVLRDVENDSVLIVWCNLKQKTKDNDGVMPSNGGGTQAHYFHCNFQTKNQLHSHKDVLIFIIFHWLKKWRACSKDVSPQNKHSDSQPSLTQCEGRWNNCNEMSGWCQMIYKCSKRCIQPQHQQLSHKWVLIISTKLLPINCNYPHCL